MKKLKVFTVVFGCFFMLSVYAHAVEFRKGFNNYQIEAVDNTHAGSDIQKVWNLTYEGSENPVSVAKRNTPDGTVYIVNSKFFEICYVASSNGFGARTVKRAWSSVPKQINSMVVNSDEVKRQEILTPEKVDDEKALGLIASYLPSLINDQYVHLLN